MVEDEFTTRPTALDLDGVKQQLIDESNLRPSIIARAEKRLRDIQQTEDRWVLKGRWDLDDQYEEYEVSRRGKFYCCSCHAHYGGEEREAHMCSHVVAVIMWRRIRRSGYVQAEPEAVVVAGTPSPADIGMPAKFTEWRGGQFEVIQKIVSYFS